MAVKLLAECYQKIFGYSYLHNVELSLSHVFQLPKSIFVFMVKTGKILKVDSVKLRAQSNQLDYYDFLK